MQKGFHPAAAGSDRVVNLPQLHLLLSFCVAAMIMMGLANVDSPNQKEMLAFHTFLNTLKDTATALQLGTTVKELRCYRIPIVDMLKPSLPRFISKWQMSGKAVDKDLCTKCNECATICPYGAIQIKDFPEFDLDKCQNCWRCYNICPTKAIYT